MRKIYLSLMLMVAFPFLMTAQTFIQVGTATTTTTATGPSPFGTWYHDNLNQLIFTAAELQAAGIGPGLINGISMNVTSVGSPALTVFNISMGHTTMNQFGSYWVPQGTLTQVYTANNLQPTTGWNVFNFPSPFLWNGVDNLVIQTCFDNSSYSTTHGVEYTATTFPSNRYIYDDYITGACDTNSYASSWNTPANGTERPNVRFYWIPNVNDDAGIAAIDSPFVPGCTFGSALYVQLQNLGADTLFNATINWSVNGVSQTPVIFSGAIPPISNQQVFVDNYGFSNFDVVSVWTTNPNGNNDLYSNNDTLTINLDPALSGTYTIGGATADFPNVQAAAAALAQRGVCGPVEFMVNNGTYNGQVVFNPIFGSSAVNTISFESTSGDSTQAIITSTASGASGGTIKIAGADFISFKGLTIENTSTSTYASAVRISNGSTDISFENNVIKIPVSTGTWYDYAVIYATGANHNNAFRGNLISGGAMGAYYGGSSTANMVNGPTFQNNEVMNPYYSGLYFEYASAPIVEGNHILTTNNYTWAYYGIYLDYCGGAFRITGNKVLNPSTATYAYLVYTYYTNGSNNNRGIIANNFLMAGDELNTYSSYGIYTYYSTNIEVYNNNVNILGTSTSNYGAYLYYGGGVGLHNNILASQSGYALYVNTTYITGSDYNNFYAPGGTMAFMSSAYNTLSAWQSGTGFDMNSYNVNPNYVDSANLHVCNDALNGTGMPMGLTYDIDMDLRNPNMPDIGADEFLGTKPTLGPDTTVCANAPFNIRLYGITNSTYLWSTGDVTESIAVNAPALYWVDVTNSCGTSSDTIEVFHKQVPTANFAYSNSYLTGIFTNLSGSGDTFMWDFGDGSTSTDENPTHVFQNPGTHTITFIASNECGSDTSVTQVNVSITGVSENSLDGHLSIFPNPSNGTFTMNLAGMDGQAVSMTVVDLNGRVLADRIIRVGSNDYKQNFDFSNELSSGVYFVKVQNENGAATARIVVQ